MVQEPERQVIPRTIKVRVTLDHPTPQEVHGAIDALVQAGAPQEAVISFNPWNMPNDRYYVVATWEEQ